MSDRFTAVTARSARQHGGVSTMQLERIGVDRRLRSKWVRRGLIARAGPGSYVVVGSTPTWRRDAWCAAADVAGRGYVAGRTAARLLGLDGFGAPKRPPEVLLRREHRGAALPFVAATTRSPLGHGDTVVIDGIRCLGAERLIIEAPLFGFTRDEIESAIDSAIRTRRANEARLRDAVLSSSRPGVHGGRFLRDALIDAGGESRLERWFLAIVRVGGVPRPEMRVICRVEGGFAARLDARFPGGLVVELEGHATHSSRKQRQHDEERRTRLILLGLRVIVFTYNDVRDRPEWVLATLRKALALCA